MRLIKCHAVSFGTLQSFELEFSDGLTALCEKNGFGKTTLAAFIKAMFYGLPYFSGNAKKTLDQNERKRYSPWKGGVFGGTIDFEVKDKQYRIERFFGKTNKDDEFRLLDIASGQPSADYTEKIGIELFGIDAESFENSIFFSQIDLKGGITPMISAKLNNLGDTENDLGEYENALDALEKRRKYYEAGQSGLIPKTDSAIAEVEYEVADSLAANSLLKEISEKIAEKEKEADEVKGKISAEREKINVYAEQSAAVERRKNADKVRSDLEECNKKVNAYRQAYPDGFPEKEGIVKVKTAVSERNMLLAATKAIEGDYDEYSDSRRALNAYFAGGVPSEDDISACRDDIKTYQEKLASASELRKTADIGEGYGGGSGKLKLLTVIFALVTAVGIGLIFLLSYLGIAVITAGVVLTVIFSVKVYKTDSFIRDARENADRIEAECKTAEEEAAAAVCGARAFTENYSDKAPEEAITEIAENAALFRKLIAQEEKFEKYNSDLRKIAVFDTEIGEFFEKYNLDGENESAEIDRLAAEIDDYERLTERQTEYTNLLSDMPKEENVPLITESLDELNAAEGELIAVLDGISAELTELKARIPVLTAKVEVLTEAEERLDALHQEKELYLRNVTAIKTAAELLKAARDSLAGKYSDKILAGFNKYAEKLFKGHGTVRIDAELKVTVECDGIVREQEVFSRGLRDMITLCLKFSLSDALYSDEKPLLILDDPFVNSDDERVSFALETVKELAKERQIVYLTCHSGRMP